MTMLKDIATPSIDTVFDEALEHHQSGRIAEAEQRYRQILEIDPDHADSLHLLGMIAYEAGNCDTAIEKITRAIQINPRASSYHSNLGNVLQHLGRAREAGSSYLNALKIKPDLVEAQVNLGHLFLRAENAVHAIEWYERAISLRPDLPEVHKNLGDAHRANLNSELAQQAYERAIALRPDYMDAIHELGLLLRSTHDLEGALNQFRRVQAIDPTHPRAGFAEALVLLLQGNFREGWAAYERRWTSTDHATPLRAYTQPSWQGERIEGALLLWPEQGIGDEIMFSCAIPDVLRAGIRCILECDRRLQPLFSRSFPGVEVIPVTDNTSGPSQEIAAQLPVGSLPGLYRNGWSDFHSAQAPYLQADPDRREHFRNRYAGSGKIIGLAWHSNNLKTGAGRSIALDKLHPLLSISGIRWVSLQYGEHAELDSQATAASVRILIDPEVDQLQDMDAFAAQVSAMDLVITIDNTTAHLAGALGVPVWLLLPYAPDWRWMISESRSPWYSTMRIFQQKKRNDWVSVVTEVSDALQAI
jgi:tetratricopeptide (TPR) repeat protein